MTAPSKTHTRWSSTRYFAVAETGACSSDYQRWEESANCGHAHKTYEAACECLAKKQRYYCLHGRVAGTSCAQCSGSVASSNTTSAEYYGGKIHNQHGQRQCGDDR